MEQEYIFIQIITSTTYELFAPNKKNLYCSEDIRKMGKMEKEFELDHESSKLR